VVGASGAALATKLGITEGTTLALLNAPSGLRLDLPPGVSVKHKARGRADVVLVFTGQIAKLEGRMDALGAMVFPPAVCGSPGPRRPPES
jgi:hypothetical protein